MANKDNLGKIVKEFTTIDEFYNRTKTQESQTCDQKSYPIRRGFVGPKTPIDCNQAAKRYGGIVIKDFQRKNRK
ncbi:hypothetical protein CASFOL_030102 [Castilleja foliolosa]|uniref:Uncharacterized protein n=1 Tax=Castilleja foliolosa TaxID=1961234 RepID=A0ABD3CAE8_9LAMI